MPTMTRERARFLIVDAMADAFDPRERTDELVRFHAAGLGTDDETTTWAQVFAAADLRGWSKDVSVAADRADAWEAARS